MKKISSLLVSTILVLASNLAVAELWICSTTMKDGKVKSKLIQVDRTRYSKPTLRFASEYGTLNYDSNVISYAYWRDTRRDYMSNPAKTVYGDEMLSIVYLDHRGGHGVTGDYVEDPNLHYVLDIVLLVVNFDAKRMSMASLHTRSDFVDSEKKVAENWDVDVSTVRQWIRKDPQQFEFMKEDLGVGSIDQYGCVVE